MKAVIPAAGLGTRFLPATKAQPKEMLPIVDKPTIQFVVEEAINSGIDDILIITGRGKRAIEDHFDRSFELEEALREQGKTDLLREIVDISEMADIHYVRQKERRGLGHAIYCARNHVGDEPFVVLLGDTIVESEVPCTKQLMNFYQKYNGSMIAVEEVPEEKINSYGIVDPEVIDDFVYHVKDLVEKPTAEEAPSNLGIIGRYLLTPEIFNVLKETQPGEGSEIQLTDALHILKEREEIYACKFTGKRYDIGNKIDYLTTCIEYGLENKETGSKLREYLKDLCNR
ncbi:MAG: UTP--glucose-1-phosphate uridylyltransferase GalU [Candidatus Altiarchaeota archaeon]|nr:UTP--glucose-1-phosphate uridylyltransferase GalU [Candidatus Altiarchaeota archaeon]